MGELAPVAGVCVTPFNVYATDQGPVPVTAAVILAIVCPVQYVLPPATPVTVGNAFTDTLVEPAALVQPLTVTVTE
jgi:hypothetical protein